jgi:predicted carbohydrate-binding protein with CBM5 and CBM33 domain
MSDQAKALGALLLTISGMCDEAEAHGIVQNPPAIVLGTLVDDAAELGVEFSSDPTLAELHMAVDAAAQRSSAVGV